MRSQGAMPKVANPVVVHFMVDGIDANTVRTATAQRRHDAGLAAQGGCRPPTPTTARARRPGSIFPTARVPGAAARARTSRCTRGRICSSRTTSTISFSARGGRASCRCSRADRRTTRSSRTPTHLYYGANELTDAMVVDHGLQHLTKDNARLLRLHLQHIRNAWRGPVQHDRTRSQSTSSTSSRPSIHSSRG